MIDSSVRPRGLNDAERLIVAALICFLYLTMEIASGSGYAYSSLVALYVGSVIFAIRCIGGLNTIIGAIIGWYACQHVLISQVVKFVNGEAGESRLLRPIPTIVSEILVMLGFAAACLVGGAVRPNRNRPLFPPINDVTMLRRMAGAALLLSVARTVALFVVPSGIATMLRTLGIIDSLAVASAVAVTLLQSKGKRLASPLVLTMITAIIVLSMMGSGRLGVVFPVAVLFLSGWAYGYRFRIQHYLIAVTFGLVFFFIISPYSLIARGKTRGMSYGRALSRNIDILTEVAAHPLKYQIATPLEKRDIRPETLRQNYFNIPWGNGSNVLNRMALIKPNDLIVDDTIRYGTTGWANITPGLSRLLPSALVAEKNFMASGTTLAHRVPGMINPGDYVTGITIGLTADAFSAFGYVGAFLIPFGCLVVIIIAYKLMFRLDLRRNVYALALVLPTAHGFSEPSTIGVLGLGTYVIMLNVLAFLTVRAAMELFDFRYLRPTSVSLAMPDAEFEPRPNSR